ncbi:MAG: dioxygenase [Longimicrobiaceae bacterium]
MLDTGTPGESRRQFLRTLVAVGGPALLGLRCAEEGAAKPEEAAVTPACEDGDDADATAPETEGPFFKPSSPRRHSLLDPGITGTKLVVVGTVLTRRCRPVAGALLDFWQADDGGNYDNAGFRLRGHQFADAKGAYRLETIVPGVYPGRTRHIHVKVQAPGRPVLTTQLYFPGEPRNARDGIFHESLLMRMAEAQDGREGRFDFVLDMV